MSAKDTAMHPEAWPAGEGDMAARIRAFDWAATKLGAIATWPSSLRTAVGIMLGAHQPAAITWGESHACLYNDACAALLGPERHPTLLGRPARAFFEAVWPQHGLSLERVRSTGQPGWHEHLRLSVPRDGRMVETSWTSSCIPIAEPGAAGGVGGVLVLLSETTEVLAVQKEADHQRRALFEAMDEGYTLSEVIYDADGRPVDLLYLDANAATRRIAGVDVMGRRFSELYDVEQDGRWITRWAEVAETGRPHRSEQHVPSVDTWIDVHAFKAEPGNAKSRRVAALIHDIGGRKRHERALQESEQRFRGLVEGIAQAVWETDADGRVVEDSPSWRAYTGQTLDEWRGDGWVDAVHPQDRAFAERQWREAVAARRNVDGEFRLRHGDGYRWTNVRAVPIVDGDGAIRKWVGMNVDIDARKRAEDALRASEAQLQLALEGAELGTWSLDLVGGDSERSPRYDQIFGYDTPRAHWTLADAEAHVLEEDRPLLAQHVETAMRTGVYTSALRIRRADGEIRWINAWGRVYYDEAGRPVRMAGVVEDDTDFKQAELARQTAEQRMSVLVRASAQALYRMSADWSLMRELGGGGFESGGEFLSEARETAGWMDVYIPPDEQPVVRAAIDHAIRTRSVFSLVHRVRRADGSIGWTASRAVPILEADGSIREWVGAASDITERKQHEIAERERAAREAFLLRLSDAMRPLTDPSEVQTVASRLVSEHLGVSRALYVELHGQRDIETGALRGEHVQAGERMPQQDGFSVESFVDPQLLLGKDCLLVQDVTRDPRFTEAQRSVWQASGVVASLNVPLEKHGVWRAVFALHSSEPRAWTEAETALAIEVAQRTWAQVERARAESALRESEQRFLTLADSIDDVFYITDLSRNALDYLSPGYERIWGRSVESLMEDLDAFVDTLHPDDRDGFADAKQQQLAGENVTREYRILRPDGEVRWIYDRSFPVPGSGGLRSAGIASDITAERALSDAHRESETRLRHFGEASSDVLWIRDAATLCWEYVSPAYEAIYGESLPDAARHAGLEHWLAAVEPEDRDYAARMIERVRAGERVTFEFRIRRRSDGAQRWVRNTDFPLRDAEGKVVRIGGIGQDVTELKRAQAAMADSEHRLRTLMECIPQLVWRSRGGGDWTWSSPQWQAYTGQSLQESLGMGWLEAVHPEDRADTLEAWRRAAAHRLLDVEYRVRRFDGTYCWHHTRSLPHVDPRGAVMEWLGTSTDVQALKELQGQQQVLVAELQHRTRNLIGVVSALADRTASGSDTLEDFNERFGDRLTALARVQGLLSRRDAGQKVTFDQLIHTELRGLGALDATGHGAQVALDGPPGVRLRSATVQTFALALHELATNAVKYGALSTPDGRLEVLWRLQDEDGDLPKLCVQWSETGIHVPPERLAPDARRGYGRELIERALPYQLKARTDYALTPEGVRCTIVVPLARATRRATA